MDLFGALTVLLLAAGSAAGPSLAAAPPPAVVRSAPRPLNLAGATLVLDTGSLSFRGNHPVWPGLGSPDGCSAQCDLLPGCTGWNFCGAKDGCGSGCKAYAQAHPPLQPHATGNPTVIADADKTLPLLRPGPWAQPYGGGGCQVRYDPASGRVVVSDAWAFGTCSLKRVDNPEKPGYYGASGEGWTSGTVQVPSQCAGLPAAACDGCLSARRAAECLACAKDPRAGPRFGLDYLLGGVRALRACALCANVTAADARKQCFDCVLGNKPCADCVYTASTFGPGPPDIAACLSCVASRGDAYRGPCSACAQAGSGAGRCFACLAAAPLKLCAEGASPYAAGGPVGAPPSCWSRTDRAPCDICGAAAKSEAARQACLSCFAGPPGAWGECRACTWLDGLDAAAQERCFSCARRANFTTSSASGCSACFYQWVAPGSRERCLACVESPATPMAGKSTCAYCYKQGPPPAGGDECAACLAKGGRADFGSCVGGGRRR